VKNSEGRSMVKENRQELNVEGAGKRVVLARSFLDKEDATKSIFEGEIRQQSIFCSTAAMFIDF
jgi:hypothetical protein